MHAKPHNNPIRAAALSVVWLAAALGCDPAGIPVAPRPSTGAGAGEERRAPDQAPDQRPETPDPQAAAATDDPHPLLDKTFDDLKFDIEPDAPFERDMLTEANKALDGRRLRIRGYILPTAQKRGIKQFVLVRDNQECCFGPGAALYDCVLVSMRDGRSTEFSIRPVAVTGTLRIEEFLGPDGRPLAIYQMTGDGVE